MKRYEYRCPKKGKRCPDFMSDKQDGAVCPTCGRIGYRIYSSVPAFHPTRGAK